MKKLTCFIALMIIINTFIGCVETQNTDLQIENESKVTSYEQVSSTEIHTPVYRIEYEFILLENNNVGNEWTKSVFVNGIEYKSGDAISAKGGESVEIKIFVSENDKIPDQNIKTVLLNIKDGEGLCEAITVCENRGQYSGNTALWQFSCRVIKK